MTIKLFVGKDSQGRDWPPDHSHEISGLVEIFQKLWLTKHHLPQLYALVANIHQPSADLIVFSEYGLGVIELKHYFGKVTMGPDKRWYAGSMLIKAGSRFITPREQVQDYAMKLRPKLLRKILPADLQNKSGLWDSLAKVHTAVCFTNDDSDITQIKQLEKTTFYRSLQSWESAFQILKCTDVPQWVAGLRFGNYGHEKDFAQVRVTPDAILGAITSTLQAIEWSEMLALMPTAEPYGYLYLQTPRERQPFSLTEDDITIGRHSANKIVIPNSYTKVSNRHCRLLRTVNGIELLDLNSRNGTFINSEKVSKIALKHGMVIQLGSDLQSGGCLLRFSFRDQSPSLTVATQFASESSEISEILSKDDSPL